jgi:hypothetical protein
MRSALRDVSLKFQTPSSAPTETTSRQADQDTTLLLTLSIRRKAIFCKFLVMSFPIFQRYMFALQFNSTIVRCGYNQKNQAHTHM